jgi:chemotaxis protein CheC
MELTEKQIKTLASWMARGADHASKALTRWSERNASVDFNSLKQVGLQEVATFLGPADAILVACVMELSGGLRGTMMFCFDDTNGFRLSDIILNRTMGESRDWQEWERSAVLETANILGCTYLNSIATAYAAMRGASTRTLDSPQAWLPGPPQFIREYSAAILEFAVMQQAAVSDTLLLSNTQFHIDNLPMQWNLLFIPDEESLKELARVLS